MGGMPTPGGGCTRIYFIRVRERTSPQCVCVYAACMLCMCVCGSGIRACGSKGKGLRGAGPVTVDGIDSLFLFFNIP